jgi:hypothetical protein
MDREVGSVERIRRLRRSHLAVTTLDHGVFKGAIGEAGDALEERKERSGWRDPLSAARQLSQVDGVYVRCVFARAGGVDEVGAGGGRMK